MSRLVWLPMCVAVATLLGCQADADVDGAWNVTLSLRSENGDVSQSFPGQLNLQQFFSGVEGTGTVSGPDCEVRFAVQGQAFDEYNIPVVLDFIESNCANNPFQDNAEINLNLLDDGRVLYGHHAYTDNNLLYVSASIDLY